MESDRRASDPTPDEAREALRGLDADGAALAARVVTPPWYHPINALLVAAFIIATAIPGSLSTIVIALAVVGLALLVITYQRRYGVATSQPAGPRSRRLLGTMVAVMVLCMGSGLAIKLAELSPWWSLLPAALAFALTVVLGRAYDATLRTELAQNGSARA